MIFGSSASTSRIFATARSSSSVLGAAPWPRSSARRAAACPWGRAARRRVDVDDVAHVAERGQPLQRLGVEAAAARAACVPAPARQRLQPHAQVLRARGCRPCRCCCVSPGSALQVVELGLGRVDELVAVVAQAAQVLPAEVVAREVRLRVRDVAAAARAGSSERARQRAAVDARLRAAGPRRSSTVGMRSTLETWAALRPRDAPGRAHDERHVRGGVVDEVGVASPRRGRPGSRRGRRSARRPCAPSSALRLAATRCSRPDHRVRVGDLAEVGLARGSARRTAPAARRACAGRRGGPRRRSACASPSSSHASASSITSSPGFCTVPSEIDLVLREVEAVGVLVEALGRGPSATRAPRRRRRRPSRSPPPCSRSASVTCASSRKKPPLSRTPWCGGMRPVKIDECDGKVSGTVAVACSKTTPSRREARRCAASRRRVKP